MQALLVNKDGPVCGAYRAFLLVLFSSLLFAEGLNLLSIGDSVDRYMVEDYCTVRGPSRKGMCGGLECTYFLDGILKPGVFPTSSMLCLNEPFNESVAFVQIYGSEDTGPYYNPERGTHDDWHVNSPDRINASIAAYFDRVGVPDLVTLNSILWDTAHFFSKTYGGWNAHVGQEPRRGDYDVKNSPLYDAACTSFEADLRKRLLDIESALGINLRTTNTKSIRARMGLRTAVWSKANGLLLHAFNDIARRIAAEVGILLYDYDTDLWSSVDFDVSQEKKILRDAIHPQQLHTRLAAEKMLRNVYTSALIIPSPSNSSGMDAVRVPRVWWEGSPEPRPARITKVSLLQDAALPAPRLSWAATAISERDNSSSSIAPFVRADHHNGLWLVVSAADNAVSQRLGKVPSVLINGFGPADICRLPSAQLSAIPQGPPIPHEFFTPGARIAVNESGVLWLIADGTRRVVTPQFLEFFNISLLNVDATRNKEGERARVVGEFLPILVPTVLPPLPNIYKVGTLVRWAGSREVFALLEDKKLHLVPSANVFFARGWDFSSVVVVNDKRDVDLLPTGDTLQ